jgi:hypothetical protein
MRPASGAQIKSFGGTRTPIQQVGTIRWVTWDDQGQQRTIIIPNSFYVPSGHTRLLSPQHWSQEAVRTGGQAQRVTCITSDTSVKLRWDGDNIIKIIPLDPTGNNMATIWATTVSTTPIPS